MSIITVLLWKWCYNNKHLAELAPQNGGKTAGIHMIWRNYVIVTLCIDNTKKSRWQWHNLHQHAIMKWQLLHILRIVCWKNFVAEKVKNGSSHCVGVALNNWFGKSFSVVVAVKIRSGATFGDTCHRFLCSSWHPTNSVKALHETQSTDVIRWRGIILSSSATVNSNCPLFASSPTLLTRFYSR